MIDKLPKLAVQAALDKERASLNPDPRQLVGLEHTLECLNDMSQLLQHLREKLPTYEPDLDRLITRQLIRGCGS